MKSLLQRFLVKLAFILGALLVAFFLFELVLRLFYQPKVNRGLQYHVPHPVLGWKPKPGGAFVHRTWEFSIDVAYNSEGWHDVEHSREKPPGTFRIVVLGDSFMEAYTAPLEASFARQLEHLAGEAATQSVEVINLGVSGYSTLQNYLAFTEIGRHYQPDLVLLGFTVINDVFENSPELLARLWVESEEVNDRPFLDSGAASFNIIPSDYEATLAAYEREMALVQAQESRFRLYIGLLLKEALENIRVRNLVLNGPPFDHDIWLGVHKCTESPAYTQAWTLTARILAQLRRDVHHAGALLVVFSVPAAPEVDEEIRQITLQAVDNPESFCFQEAPGHARLAGILAEQDIPFIDLLPFFREHNNSERLYWWTDHHWNPAGHILAAEEVSRYLEANEWLGKSP